MKKTTELVTITLNPAIDETVFVDQLRVGEVNRARGLHFQPGGKGINVSRMLSGFGIETAATGFLGKVNGEIYKRLFEEKTIEDEFVWTPGRTRTGIKIVSESARQTTDINFPGFEPSLAALEEFEARIRKMIQPGRWFVLAGSLPKGLGIDFFEELIVMLKRGGARVAVDTSGESLNVAIEHGVDLIKPNEHELAEVLKCSLSSFSEKVEAALELQRTKVSRVILSLGSEGALFATSEKQLMASAPPVKVVSTVGAGDALLSGYLAGVLTGVTPVECARLATVFAWCNLENVERRLPSREEILERLPQIQVQSLSKMKSTTRSTL
jgi:1-phosphofructokinase